MVANPKQALYALIDQLSDNEAAETLAYARQLLGHAQLSTVRPQPDAPERPHTLPTLHSAPPISTIDELRAAVFAPEERVEEFDAAIRRWREESEGV